MNLIEAIEERRTRLSDIRAEEAQLEGELEQLEKAQDLVEGILSGGAMKPPPRAEKKPVRKATEPRPHRSTGLPRTQPGDKKFARCGHPNITENHTSQGRCKACAKESQRRWQEKHARKTTGGRTPKTKAEPDPAPVSRVIATTEWQPLTAKPQGLVLTEAERAKLLKLAKPGASRFQRAKAEEIVEKGEKRAELKAAIAPVTAVIAPPNPITIAGASNWQRQCTKLDFDSGKRCTLMAPHSPPHSASGRTFYTGIDAKDLPAASREIDAVALRGRS